MSSFSYSSAFAASSRLSLLAKNNPLATAVMSSIGVGSVVQSNTQPSWRSTTTTCEAQTKRPAVLRHRMTPIGRFSVLSETPYNPSIVTCFMQLEGGEPLTKASLVQLWKERRMMELHPRFHQTVSASHPGYFEEEGRNSRAQGMDHVERHFTESFYPVEFRNEMKKRISQIQMTQWNLSDSLWHMYVVPARQPWKLAFSGSEDEAKDSSDGQSLVLFRCHHALADGASLFAAMLDLFDEAGDVRRQVEEFVARRRKRVKSLWQRLCQNCLFILWFLTGSIQSVAYQLYLSLVESPMLAANPWSVLESTATTVGVPPERSISWSSSMAPVDQVKWVAQRLVGPKATVNDVFVSCVMAALAKQLGQHRERQLISTTGETSATLPRQQYMNVTIPVHLKGGVVLPGESVGNQIGAFVARLPGEVDSTPQERLVAVHKELRARKQTPVPLLSHFLAKSLSLVADAVLPRRWLPWMYARANAGSVAVVTNTRGPSQPFHLQGRRVNSIIGFVPLAPGLPMGIVVGSYAGNMSVTIAAQTWAVPDADQFLAWVLEEYLALLQVASSEGR